MPTFENEESRRASLEEERAANAMTPGERLLMGPRRFDAACREIQSQIRGTFPDAPDRTVRRLLQLIVDYSVREEVL